MNLRFIAGFILLVSLSFEVYSQGTPKRIYVDSTATGGNNGTSWTDAYTRLSIALIAPTTNQGDTILIAQGTYYPNYPIIGGPPLSQITSLSLKDGLVLLGGFPQGGSLIPERNWKNNLTILSGDIDRDGSLSGNSFTVLRTQNASTGVVLDGFIIEAGNAAGTGGIRGDELSAGGLSNRSTGSKESIVQVRNTVFRNNQGTNFGGAVGNFAQGSRSTINFIDCVFENNRTGSSIIQSGGGAIYNSARTRNNRAIVGMLNCTVKDNESRNGGAIFNDDQGNGRAEILIANSLFFDNKATNTGGAISNNSTVGALNTTFVENTVDNANGGGAIESNGATSKVELVNSIVWGNQANDVPNDISSNSEVIFRHTVFGQTTGSSSFTNINSFNANPLFVDVANDDFSLTKCSPAVNTGINDSITPITSVDLDNKPRIFNQVGVPRVVDMGAYEFQAEGYGSSDTIVYVDSSAISGSQNGVNWSNAYVDIQQAIRHISNCSNVKYIYVAKGTYYPTDGTDRTISFDLPEGVRIIGGFPTGGSSIQARDWFTNTTYLSGNIGDKTISTDNSYSVVLIENKADVQLDGLIISDGQADDNMPANANTSKALGGGLYILDDAAVKPSSIRLDNMVFRNNIARQAGGGLFLNLAEQNIPDILISNSYFVNNRADIRGGGGIGIDAQDAGTVGEVSIVNTFLESNTSVQGGAVYTRTEDAQVNLNITNITAVKNRGNTTGGFIYLANANNVGRSNANIGNTILWNNGTNPLQGEANTHISIEQSLLNSIACPTANVPTAIVNCQGNNLFNVYPNFSDTAQSDYRLTFCSPAIDAGVNTLNVLLVDALRQDRVFNGEIDLGAFENQNHTDTIPPKSLCVSLDTILLGRGETIQLDSNALDSNSVDNCSIDSIWLSQDVFTCADVGLRTVKQYVRDASDNLDSCISRILVLDTFKVRVFASDRTVYLSDNGQASIDSAFVVDSVWVNCSPIRVTLSQITFTCADVGRKTILVQAIPTAGKIDSINIDIEVRDTTKPVLNVRRNAVVYIGPMGNATLAISDLLIDSSDNCGVEKLELSKDNFTCVDVSQTAITVDLTAEDGSGNQTIRSSQIRLVDTTSPQAMCIARDTVYLNGQGVGNLTNTALNNGSSDNCSIDSIWLSQNVFTCADVGLRTVKQYVRDASENLDSCTSTLLVLDTFKVRVFASDRTVYLSDNGQVSIDSAFVIDSLKGAVCSDIRIRLSQSTFDCADIGTPQEITVQAISSTGGSDETKINMRVIDTVAPRVTFNPHTLYLDQNGQALLSIDDIVLNASDACGVALVELSKNTFTCVDVSQTATVDVTVTDNNNNRTVRRANLRVLDTVSPVLVCQPFTLFLTDISATPLNQNSVVQDVRDNCEVQSVEISKSVFSCADVGVNEITITAIDRAGNRTQCNTMVTVVDNVSNLDISLDQNEFCSGVLLDVRSSGGEAPYKYFMNGIGVDLENLTAPEEGEHFIAIQDANECVDTAKFVVLPTVDLEDNAIELKRIENFPQSIVYTLEVDSSLINPNATVLWQSIPRANISFNCTQQNLCHSISTTPLETTTYKFFEINQDICQVDSFIVRLDKQFSMPNVFYPNSEDIQNRTFDFYIAGALRADVNIYNRWGALIYSKTGHIPGKGNGWDGTYNGRPSPEGTYVYQIRAIFFDGLERIFGGDITLIR